METPDKMDFFNFEKDIQQFTKQPVEVEIFIMYQRK